MFIYFILSKMLKPTRVTRVSEANELCFLIILTLPTILFYFKLKTTQAERSEAKQIDNRTRLKLSKFSDAR